MNIREIILTPEAVKYKELAKRELFVLEAQRVTANQVAKRKVFQIEGVFALLYTSRMTKKLIMWGGRGPQIFLTNYTDAWAYDYYSDAVSNAVFAETVATALPAKPLYNGRNQVGDLIQSTYSQGWTSESIGNPYLFLGGLNSYEMGVFHDGSEVYGRIAGTIGHIATVPDTFLSEFAKPYGSLFGLPGYKTSAAWNLFRGSILYTLNPANKSLQDSWYWTPSLFSVQPADAYGLKPGWYYGEYPSPDYDGENALVSLKVSLKAILDTRYTGGLYNYGWAELVTEVDGVEKTDLNFYLQAGLLSVPSNSYDTNISVAGTTADQYITTGSDVQGFDRTFSMQAAVTALFSWWICQMYGDAGEDSGVCVAIIDGPVASFTRFSGYQSTVYETITYHSHATDRLGSLLAVFESDDGALISRVRVFDLFGTREVKDGADYTAGGFTELRASTVVASVEALTGCVIPHRVEGFEPLVVGYDLETAVPAESPSDYTDYLPSLSTLAFIKTGVGALTMKKVVCSNGVDAEYGITTDDCFASTVVIEDPDVSNATEKKIGSWDEGGVIRGMVRGEFTGAHPNMRFAGAGSGESITLPDTFSIIESETGTLTFEGYVGDLSIGSCITTDSNGDYIPDPTCDVPSCEGTYKATASSSCGQTALLELELSPPATLSVSGPDYAEQGDEYIATGGIGPYTFDLDGTAMSVVDDTGTITQAIPYCSQGSWTARSYLQNIYYYCVSGDTTSCIKPNSGTAFLYGGASLPTFQEDGTDHWGPASQIYQTNDRYYMRGCYDHYDADGDITNYCYTNSNSGVTHSGQAYRFRGTSRLELSPPRGVIQLYYSTNYGCEGVITATDSCGTVASLIVNKVPT